MNTNSNPKAGTGMMIAGGVLFVALIAGAVMLMGGEKRESAGAGGAAVESGYGSVPADAVFMRQSGEPMTLGDLRGKVWVASFIFTRCQGTCPMMTKSMSELQDDLKKIGDVRLVSFTVDPEYDTPERLQEYAKEYGADESRWLFLQGSDSAVQSLAKDAFHVGIAEGTSQEEPIIHSSRFFVVDGAGEIRGMYDGRTDEGKRELLAGLTDLLDETGSGRGH